MSERLVDLKRSSLEKRLLDLQQEYKAVVDQIGRTLSAADRLKLQRQAAQLEQNIAELEQDLADAREDVSAEQLAAKRVPKSTWKALISIDEFLRHGLARKISETGVADPEQWTEIWDALRILREDRPEMSSQTYEYIQSSLLQRMQDNVNALLDIMREALAAKQTSAFDDEYWTQRASLQLQKAQKEFAEGLDHIIT